MRIGHPFPIELLAVSLRRAAEVLVGSARTDATVSPSLNLGAMAGQSARTARVCEGQMEKEKKEKTEGARERAEKEGG